MKKGCKVSCVKIINWLIVFKEGTDTLSLYIFDYGAECGVQCSTESGAKQYFTKQRNAVRPTEETEKDIDGARFESRILVDLQF